jgi:hypothetical protein
VVSLAGRILEIDPVLGVLGDVRVIELIDDPESASDVESTVRVERVAEPLDFEALLELLGSVGAQRNDLEPERRQLRLDLAQLTELRVAIRSPATAVEDEERATFADRRLEVHRFSENGLNNRLRDLRAW